MIILNSRVCTVFILALLTHYVDGQKYFFLLTSSLASSSPNVSAVAAILTVVEHVLEASNHETPGHGVIKPFYLFCIEPTAFSPSSPTSYHYDNDLSNVLLQHGVKLIFGKPEVKQTLNSSSAVPLPPCIYSLFSILLSHNEILQESDVLVEIPLDVSSPSSVHDVIMAAIESGAFQSRCTFSNSGSGSGSACGSELLVQNAFFIGKQYLHQITPPGVIVAAPNSRSEQEFSEWLYAQKGHSLVAATDVGVGIDADAHIDNIGKFEWSVAEPSVVSGACSLWWPLPGADLPIVFFTRSRRIDELESESESENKDSRYLGSSKAYVYLNIAIHCEEQLRRATLDVFIRHNGTLYNLGRYRHDTDFFSQHELSLPPLSLVPVLDRGGDFSDHVPVCVDVFVVEQFPGGFEAVHSSFGNICVRYTLYTKHKVQHAGAQQQQQQHGSPIEQTEENSKLDIEIGIELEKQYLQQIYNRNAFIVEAMRTRGRDAFPTILNIAGVGGIAVEIGVASGDYAMRFLEQWNGDTYVMVDPWRSWSESEYVDSANDHQHVHDERLEGLLARINESFNFLTQQRIKSEEVDTNMRLPAPVILRHTSSAAAQLIPNYSLSFCFIDAQHHYFAVMQDLLTWFPKVKRGGILAGHDFDVDHFPEVQYAVREFALKMGGLQVHETAERHFGSWFIFKN